MANPNPKGGSVAPCFSGNTAFFKSFPTLVVYNMFYKTFLSSDNNAVFKSLNHL